MEKKNVMKKPPWNLYVLCVISHQYLIQLFSDCSPKLHVTLPELNTGKHCNSCVKLTILVTGAKSRLISRENYFSSL